MTLRSGQAHGSIRTWRRHFPLTSVESVVELFRDILLSYGFRLLDSSNRLKALSCEKSLKPSLWTSFVYDRHSLDVPTSCVQEPDLVFVSIVLGSIEHHLTASDGSASFRLKSRALTLSPRHTQAFACSNKVPCSPLSVHVELPEETCEQPYSSISPTGSDTKSLDDSSYTTIHYRSGSRKRRCSERTRRQQQQQHVSPAFSGQNVSLVNFDSTSLSERPTAEKRRRFSDSTSLSSSFPCITFEETEQRYQEFYNLITTAPKLQPFILSPDSKAQDARPSTTNPLSKTPWATRNLICTVCEVLWGRMAVNKSRERLAHSQSIYSLLSAGILDSFGLAYTTVAACRLLGYSDVDLALSEDHGWVEFGPPDARQTADVASWVPGAHLLNSREPDASVLSITEPVKHEAINEDDKENANPPPIRVPPLLQSWLYVNGFPVICRPAMLAVAAAVATLQPGSSLPPGPQAPTSAPSNCSFGSPNITPNSCSADLIAPSGLARHLSSSSTISMQLVSLKHRLLWLFFDADCLSRYPLGLTNLGDLEDAFPCTSVGLASPPSLSNLSRDDANLFISSSRTNYSYLQTAVELPKSASVALALYNKAVDVSVHFYANQHVYPYTCLASCLYRHGDNRGALRYWAEAARVMGHYNHSSEDWEIYRELLEVATQLMPHMFRCAAEAARSCSEGALDADPDGCLYQPGNILDDPQCLAYLLAFYDHLCLWEEGSPVPVLHVGWVDKLMVSLARFSQRARRLLRLSVDRGRFGTDIPEQIAPSSVSAEQAFNLDSLISKRARRQSRSSVAEKDEEPSCLVTTRGSRIVEARLTENRKSDAPISPADNSSSRDGSASVSRNKPRMPLSAIPTPGCSPPREVATNDSGRMKFPKKRSATKTKSKTKSPSNGILLDQSVTFSAPTERDMRSPHSLFPLSLEAAFKSAPENGHEVGPDQNSDPQEMLLGSACSSAHCTPDIINHDDLLSSLAEACDHRLLNPAFLWGLERNVPFLPPNTAPEEVFTHLISVLEPDATSLFPTPPNSGSLYEPIENKTRNDIPTESSLLPVENISDVEDFQASEAALSNDCTEGQASEHSSDIPLFPDCLDTVDGAENMVSLDDISDELLHSVDDLVKQEGEIKTIESAGLPSPVVAAMTEPMVHSSDTDGTASDRGSHKPKTMEELTVDLTLFSIKMVSIIELLRAPRLNSSAIKLALTAQSQVCLRRTELSSTNGL